MSNYTQLIIFFFAIVMFVRIIIYVYPKTSNKKTLRVVCSVICACIFIAPIKNYLSSGPINLSYDLNEKTNLENYETEITVALENQIKQDITSRFGIKPSVLIGRTGGGKLNVLSISLTVNNSDAIEYIERVYGIRPDVIE